MRRTLLLLLAVAVTGCGPSEPTRYSVSGRVTFDGQPVPSGRINFAPDTAQGNSGPGGAATIVDGAYETLPGQGIVGGPHRVTVIGMDGVAEEMSPAGSTLFPPYNTEVDFPREQTEFDFTVPVSEESPGLETD